MEISIIALMIILSAVFVPIVLVAALVYVLMRNRPGSEIRRAERSPEGRERVAAFREKREHYEEERERILGMVESGTISADEADRLLDTLDRETPTMACPFCSEEIRAGAVKCKHCRSFLSEEAARPKRLTRSDDRMLAGVCGGLAEHFELDPTLVRILAAVVAFFSGIIAGLILYLVAALIIPDKE
jgi:phage shock protein PspC (stress-responsive transcriptional regulator)